MKGTHQIRIWSLITVMFFVGNSVHAQDDISNRVNKLGAKVLQIGSVTDVLPYLTALENINLDRYRLLDASRILKFESGVEIELISGEDWATAFGEPIPVNLTTKAAYIENPGMILQLHPSGRILEKHFKRAVK